MQTYYSSEYNKNIAMFDNKSSFLQTEFPKKIEDRINEIIDQKYTNEKGESFEIFPTPQSKIFVLQNIEDFFDFSQDNEFKIFNPIVYEVCIKKIDELQKQEKELELANAANQTENYEKMTDIDKFRANYMNYFKITTSALKNMSSEDLNNRILDVKRAINNLISNPSSDTDLATIKQRKKDTSAEEGKRVFQSIKDARFRALWSIFVHLSYKQQLKKQSMFVDADLPEQKQKEQLAKKYVVMKKSLESKLPTRLQKEILAENLRLEDQSSRSEQNSWWGNVKSSIGSWFRR